MNPQVIFGSLCNEFRPIKQSVTQQTKNEKELDVALTTVRKTKGKYDLDWCSIIVENEEGTGRASSSARKETKTPHEKNMENIDNKMNSGNLLIRMYTLIEKNRLTENHKEELKACMTRVVQMTQKFDKNTASDYLQTGEYDLGS